MTKLTVAIGASRNSTRWVNTEFTWPEFAHELRLRFRRVDVTAAAYHAMPKAQRGEIKDVGGYVTGRVREGGGRKSSDVLERSLLALDADSQTVLLDETLFDLALPGVAAVLHTTMSHTPEAPRQRVIIPLSRPVTDKGEHETLARFACQRLGIARFDAASADWNRLMYWPAATSDGEYLSEEVAGEPLEVEWALALASTWDEMPRFPREALSAKANNSRVLATANTPKQHPHQSAGLAGEFHRHYGTIDEIIREHLSDVYREGDVEGRMSLIGGEGENGLVLYGHPDGGGYQFATSHHTGHDPAAGAAGSLTGWDLVRVHKFGDGPEPEREMRAWVKTLGILPYPGQEFEEFTTPEDVQEELERQQRRRDREADKRQKRLDHLETLKAGVSGCQDLEALKAYVRDVLVPDTVMDDTDRRGAAASWVRDRFKDLGSPQPLEDVRRMLNGGSSGGAPGSAATAPSWLDRWVYVVDTDKFFDLDGKRSVTANAFDAIHGMSMPLVPGSPTVRERASVWAKRAWGIRTVDHEVYAPPEPEVFERDGRVWANLFDPASVPALAPGGEAAIRMIESHLRRMIPDPRERALLLAWMKHLATHIGRKVRWAPYIFGAQGAGKGFLGDLMGWVLGQTNVRVVSGKTLTSDFTGWAAGRILTVVDEAHQAGHLYDVSEKLKAPVSNDIIDVHPKGRDSYQMPNYTSYLATSNYADGIPIDQTDRRYMFLRSAIGTEEAKQLTAEGFYDNLFATCRGAGGQVRRWLVEEVEAHPEFDPNGRAPITEAREMVIQMSKGDAEDELESTLAGRQAVTTGWAAGHLRSRRIDARTRTVAKILSQCGFQWLARVKMDGKMQRVWARPGSVKADDQATIRQLLSWQKPSEFQGYSDDDEE